jgi:O-antigen ligase
VTSPLLFAPVSESGLRAPSFISPLDSALFYGVFSLLLFGPLAFGAVEAWAVSIMEMAVGLLFALWAARQVASGELEIVGNPLFVPMLGFAALILWQLATGRTAYWADTSSSALLYCAYGLLCFLVVQCLRQGLQVKRLAWMFSGYGLVFAMFALIQGVASNGKLYWLRSSPPDSWIYGPYVNHNHYAGLMEMLTPIPLVVSLAAGVRGPRKAWAILAAAVMAGTIFLSGSRGGMAAFAAQVALLSAFLFKRQKDRTRIISLVFFLATAMGLLAWLGGGDLAERVASIPNGTGTELSGGTRLTIDRDALRMSAQKPLLGWGLGVFGEVYPQFSSLSSNSAVGMAHNDYLQLLVEMGALGLAVAFWFLLTLYRSAARKLLSRLSDVDTAVTLAATLGISGLLVHSFVDFNLQIPANAALFYALCVVAAMAPRFGKPAPWRNARPFGRHPRGVQPSPYPVRKPHQW